MSIPCTRWPRAASSSDTRPSPQGASSTSEPGRAAGAPRPRRRRSGSRRRSRRRAGRRSRARRRRLPTSRDRSCRQTVAATTPRARRARRPPAPARPAAAPTRATVPSNGAVTGCSIFIASSSSSWLPARTSSPSCTSTRSTVPGIGATSRACSSPPPACGRVGQLVDRAERAGAAPGTSGRRSTRAASRRRRGPRAGPARAGGRPVRQRPAHGLRPRSRRGEARRPPPAPRRAGLAGRGGVPALLEEPRRDRAAAQLVVAHQPAQERQVRGHPEHHGLVERRRRAAPGRARGSRRGRSAWRSSGRSAARRRRRPATPASTRMPGPGGQLQRQHAAGLGEEAGVGVLGVQPHLDRVAAQHQVRTGAARARRRRRSRSAGAPGRPR